ncbi:MAG TPA: glycosyltransferase family 39 protein [Planctomycetota bacterium]|nr:glycosyltransferase family 39 protein [Planctomycetota bacterium]
MSGPSLSSPPPAADRRHGGVAALAAVAVLVLGIVLGAFHELGGYMVENDWYGQYLPAAQAVLEGKPMANPRSGPGYPLLVAAGTLLTGNPFGFAKVVASIALAAAGWFTFLLVRSFTGAGTALFAQLFLYAVLGRYCCMVGNDLPFVALATAALYFLLRRTQPTLVDALVAGALAGAAMSLRYPGVVVAATAAAAFWLLPPPATPIGRRLLLSAAFALPAVVCSAPAWAAHDLGLSGRKESKAYAFAALDIYAEPKDRLSQTHLDEMEVRFDSMWDVLTRDPTRVLAHYALDLFSDAALFLSDSVTLPAALFLGAGLLLWFCAGTADRRRAALCFLFALLAFGIVVLVPYQARYGYPVVPITSALVGAALVHRFAPGVRLAEWVRLACIAVVFLPPLVATGVKLREYLTSEPVELFAAADVLRPLVVPGDRIVSRKAHLAGLTGCDHVFLRPDLAVDDLLAWARTQHARFLLVGDWEVHANGNLRELRDGGSHPALRLLWQHDRPVHRLFEIAPQ